MLRIVLLVAVGIGGVLFETCQAADPAKPPAVPAKPLGAPAAAPTAPAATPTGPAKEGYGTGSGVQPAVAEQPPTAIADRAELEKQFAATMSGATLIGNYTMGSLDKPKADDTAPERKQDRYTLGKVAKLAGDKWLIETRIQYGTHDVTVPLALEVKWAGDTPVITLTDLTIPGLGTFSARVLFYRNQYAGTWSHGDKGGLLFGRVEPVKGEAAEMPEPGKDAPAK